MEHHSGGAALQRGSLIGAYRGTSFTSSFSAGRNASPASACCAPPRMGACREIERQSARASPSLRERGRHPRRSSTAAPHSPDRHRRRHVLHPHGRLPHRLARRRPRPRRRSRHHRIGQRRRARRLSVRPAASRRADVRAPGRVGVRDRHGLVPAPHQPAAARRRAARRAQPGGVPPGADLRPPHLLARRRHAADRRELPARCQDRPARRSAGRARLQRLPAHDLADPGRASARSRRTWSTVPAACRCRSWPASSASVPIR